jgi:hypothetical protein
VEVKFPPLIVKEEDPTEISALLPMKVPAAQIIPSDPVLIVEVAP